jgi:squalene-associated FAD-dependent desaturase
MPRTVHIIGAGLAGLAAAVRLARHGVAAVIHEATARAGGRCRSYDDAASGMRIDNGTHILLSGNTSALAFLADIGAMSLVRGAAAARIPFVDLADGKGARARWILDLGTSRIPFWMFDAQRRAPGTRAMDYLPLLRLLLPGPDRPLAEVVACSGPAYEKVVKPFLLATLNVDPSEGSSRLARAVVRETIAAGGAACRPYLAPKGLSAAFVDPALAHLQSRGVTVRFSDQLRRCVFAGNTVAALDFGDREIALGPEDAAIVAVPSYAVTAIIPDLTAPDEYRAIINAHFNIVPPPRLDPMIGVINGVAEWIFAFEDRISVTISGADRLLQHQREEIARMIWTDVQRATGIADEMPLWQIVRERRATFAATPAQNARRPGVGTKWRNLALAGDWTDTGLPATIESAVRSGNRAADFVLAM